MELTFDTILEKAGHVGPWQWMVFFWVATGTTFKGIYDFSYVFLAQTPEHWCHIPDLPYNLSWTDDEIKRYAIPRQRILDTDGYDSCNYYNRNYSLAAMLESGPVAPNETTSFMPCTQWHFEPSESTTVIKWNLVCDSQYLVATIEAIHMFGYFVGNLLFGSISDRYGRRRATLIAVTMMIISNLIVPFSPSYILFIFFRFLAALGVPGNYNCPFVIVTEITGSSKHRAFFGTIYNIPYAVGYMLLSGIAYYVRDWANLQLAISLPAILLFAHFWLFPESPRWLTTRGRFSEALQILKHGARLNGRTLPPDDVILAEMQAFKDKEDGKRKEQQHNGRHLVVQLFTNAGVRNLTFIVYFTWFVVALVYYGLSLIGPDRNSDKYLVFFLKGLVEFPAYILTYVVVRFFGRRPSYSGSFLLVGATCLLTLINAPGVPWLRPGLVIAGKFCITITFTISYLYTAELFPTFLRTLAIALGSTFARFGSTAAPYIVTLLGCYHEVMPLLIFGSLAIAAGLAALLLPETSNLQLPETFGSVNCSSFKRCGQDEQPAVPEKEMQNQIQKPS